MNDLISRQAAIDAMCELMRHWFGCDSKDEIREIKRELGKLPSAQQDVTDTNVGKKTCKTCHLWEDGELNIACPWGSNYEHYEDDYCSLWEKQN